MTADPIAIAPRTEPRGGLATLCVLLIMIGIVAGGAVAQSAVAARPLGPIDLAPGVVLTPLPDWEFAGRAEDGSSVILSQGSGSLAVHVIDSLDVVGGLTNVRNEWLSSRTVTASEVEPVEGVRTDHPAYRFEYSGTFADLPSPVEGEVTGVAGTTLAVLFDGWAGIGDYRAVRDEIATMIRDTVIP
jgi:hypothetical protein